ncbi:hypothetical protein FSOLCH5_014699 [Fusarium solani]
MPFQSLKPRIILCLFVWTTNVGFAIAATSTKQFKHWYPQYGYIFGNITQVNCTAEYNKYTTGVKNHSDINYLAGGDRYNVLTQPLVDCILKHTSEFLKGSMTGSQILLGIMPTIIALLGSSHDEIAMLSNVGRRPLLAVALALASPSAYFSRAFEYSDPTKILSHEKNRLHQWRPRSACMQLLVSSVEYSFAAAACCNAVNNTLQVSGWTISSFASDNAFLPNLWLGLGLCIHIFSAIVFRLRLQGWRRKESAGKGGDLGTPVGPPVKSFRMWIKDTGSRLTDILATEFVPCATDSYTVHIQTFKETKTFLVVAWWESTFTILHVIFGTLVFSGTLFVGLQDALSIVGRWQAGA